jgi:hypothetical protein
MRYGVQTARRGWLEKKDVINTFALDALLGALRVHPGAGGSSVARVTAPSAKAPSLKRKAR